jgi:hypothetical protein
MPFKAGETVLVSDPEREEPVRATVITPAESSRRPRFAWVRIEEGAAEGTNHRVPYEHLAYPGDPE